MAGRRVEPWPIAVAALLALMIASSLAFYGIARSHPDPLVVDDPYGTALRYSERVRAERAAAALDWKIDLEVKRAAGGLLVAVSVLEPDGSLRVPDRVRVRRERPAEGGLDAVFELAEQGEVFAGRVPLPRAGRWRLVVRVEEGPHRVERTFVLRTS